MFHLSFFDETSLITRKKFKLIRVSRLTRSLTFTISRNFDFSSSIIINSASYFSSNAAYTIIHSSQ